MELKKFLEQLKAKSIELRIDDNDKLVYRDAKKFITQSEEEHLKQNEQQILEILRKGDFISKTYPLSLGQEALWLIYKMAPESPAYNIIFAPFRIKAELDIEVLKQAFQALTNRHACLRTLFAEEKDGKAIQNVCAYKEAVFEQINASGWTEEKLKQKVKAAYKLPFNLEKKPPVRFHLFTL